MSLDVGNMKATKPFLVSTEAELLGEIRDLLKQIEVNTRKV